MNETMSNGTRDNKENLRNQVKNRLQPFLKSEEKRVADLILNERLDQWLDRLKIAEGSLVLAFWPTLDEEPDFQSWLINLRLKGMRFALPRMQWKTRTLRFSEMDDVQTQLDVNPLGIAQPDRSLPQVEWDQVRAIIVPGLAFDIRGGRLGRGAGFYDRTLQQAPPDIPRWAIGFDQQLVEHVPMEGWDQPVNGLILPSGLHEALKSVL